jgi:hypothetical protein
MSEKWLRIDDEGCILRRRETGCAVCLKDRRDTYETGTKLMRFSAF